MTTIAFANEIDLVDQFVHFTKHHKIKFPKGEEGYLFIWARELHVLGGGRRKHQGRIDVMGTDEFGRVWLIEAKLQSNPELHPGIWREQVLTYREALAQRKTEEIIMRSRRFLRNSRDYTSLYQAFVEWAESIGRDEAFAQHLYHQTFFQIKNQEVVSAVLCDYFQEEVLKGHPDDGYPYGYLVFPSGTTETTVHTFMINDVQKSGKSGEFYASIEDWSSLLRKRDEVKPTPENVEIFLTNKVSLIFRKCLENLYELGWTGEKGSYHVNKKAFRLDLPTVHGTDIRIHLGWVDADAQLPIEHRLPGEYGLKFNIDFRHFKHSKNKDVYEVGYQLAKRLAKEANYVERTKHKAIRHRDLTDAEKDQWDWEMQRWVSEQNRDYTGQVGELEDFEAAWRFLKEIVYIMPKDLNFFD